MGIGRCSFPEYDFKFPESGANLVRAHRVVEADAQQINKRNRLRMAHQLPKNSPYLDFCPYLLPFNGIPGGDSISLLHIRSEPPNVQGQRTDHYLAASADVVGKTFAAHSLARVLEQEYVHECRRGGQLRTFKPSSFVKSISRRIPEFLKASGNYEGDYTEIVGMHGVVSVTHGGSLPSKMIFTYYNYGANGPLLVSSPKNGSVMTKRLEGGGLPLLIGHEANLPIVVKRVRLAQNQSIILHSDGVPGQDPKKGDANILFKTIKKWGGGPSGKLVELLHDHVMALARAPRDDVSMLVLRHDPVR